MITTLFAARIKLTRRQSQVRQRETWSTIKAYGLSFKTTIFIHTHTHSHVLTHTLGTYLRKATSGKNQQRQQTSCCVSFTSPSAGLLSALRRGKEHFVWIRGNRKWNAFSAAHTIISLSPKKTPMIHQQTLATVLHDKAVSIAAPQRRADSVSPWSSPHIWTRGCVSATILVWGRYIS